MHYSWEEQKKTKTKQQQQNSPQNKTKSPNLTNQKKQTHEKTGTTTRDLCKILVTNTQEKYK